MSYSNSKTLISAIALGCAIAAGHTTASADTLSFAGRLVDGDGPVTATVNVDFRIYDMAEGGILMWEEQQVRPVDTGLLLAALGSVDPVNNALDEQIFDGSPRWLEIEIDSTILEPRVAIRAVPQSVFARTAASVGDITPEQIARVDHNHDGAYLPVSNASACTDGEQMTGIDNTTGAAMCAPDVDTQLELAASGGLALDANGELAIADGGVVSSFLHDGSVTSAKLAANAVTGSHLADNSVTAAELASNACGAAEIASNAVGSSEIANDAVGAAEIASNAVTALEIASNAVGSSEIASSAVGSSEIASNAVGSSEIASSAVGSDELASSAVTNSKLASSSVTSSKLASSAVTESKLASSAVTSAKIKNGTITSSDLASNACGSSEIASNAVGSSELASGAVTNSKLASSAVSSSKLASNSVTSSKIANNAVGPQHVSFGLTRNGGYAETWVTNGGYVDYTISSATTSFCALTRVRMQDIDSSVEAGDCEVYVNGSNNWVLKAFATSGTDADVRCRADCITWAP